MLWEFNNYVPLVDYEIKTFSQIAETSIIHYLDDEDDTKRGVPLLSFVKMDVDNLGFIFSQGIPQLSISRYVAVSRMLNYFFNTVVYHILSSQFPNAYTVLSGGDDLFIVAPFRVTIALIKKIYEEFKRFTCNNPDVHFSTGIFVSHDNFPMSKAAELAEESLESAKEKNKNAVYYFDVIGYENLFEIEKNIKWIEDKLLDKKSNVSQAFIYRLLKYTRMAKSKTFEKYLYLPKFKYDIARNIVKKDNGKIINADEVNWIENFFEKNVARNTTWLEATIVTGIYFTRKY
jgi:CRISPR-associated protein Csm1